MKRVPQTQEDAESEEALAERFLASRDTQAFATLVHRTQDFAYRVAFGRCGSALAEEVVQDAYLQLARPECRFASEGPGSFKRWLCSVVTNVARKHLRKEVRAMKRVRSREALESLQAQALAARESGDAMTDETRTALKDTLGDLDEDLRLPIVLYYFEGMTQDEVGRMVGVSQTLIARRLQQGLELLRKRLGARGVTASAAALPMLLNRPDVLSAPQSLRASLDALDLTRLAKLAAHSARASQAIPAASFPTAAVLAVTLATAVGASAWYYNTAGNAPDPTPANVAQPVDLAAPADPADERHSGTYFWNFDTGIDPEFQPQDSPVVGNLHWPFPQWTAKEGVNGSGALRFPTDGGTMKLPVGVPSGNSLPISLTFDLLALDAKGVVATTAISVSGYSKSVPMTDESTPVISWHAGRWVRFERRIARHDGGLTVAQQSYGGADAGSSPPVKADWITEPGGTIRLYIHAKNVLIDNVRLVYGEDAMTKIVGVPLANGNFFYHFDDGMSRVFNLAAHLTNSTANAPLPEWSANGGKDDSACVRFAPGGSILVIPPPLSTAQKLPIRLLFDIKPLSAQSSWDLSGISDGSGAIPLSGAKDGQAPLQWETRKWVTIDLGMTLGNKPGTENESVPPSIRLRIHGRDVLVDNVRLVFGDKPETGLKTENVTDITWHFDTGIDPAFRNIGKRPAGLQDFPLPEFQAGQGVNSSGALRFARTGGSLQLPVTLPTGKILPLYVTFDIKALNTQYAQFGTALTDKDGNGMKIRTAEPESLPVTKWHTDRWERWVRRVTLRADGKVLVEQHYGDQKVGQFGVAEGDLYTAPGGELFIELHGTDVLIDNVRLTYGPDAEAKLAREAEAGAVNK
ncbi:MAG: sigma-70 family RNA polymerase sigma factor [Planctomycetes bacterium]|nr:sigma-70 family RNA polymerase sigma factor [Planctomycetota bacterium]